MKFFVYTSVKDEYEFVEEAAIEHFAAHEFDPNTMNFSGIAIEAEDFDAAMKIYQNPGCGFGEYLFSDEPNATVVRREMPKNDIEKTFHEVQDKLENLRCMLKMKLAAMRMQEVNRLLNEVSEQMYRLHNCPSHMNPEVIFEKLSQATIHATIKYNGDTKKSG